MSDELNDQGSERIFSQISELSRQFRRQIAKGETAKIERFLGKVAKSGKETLFSSLLEIEINFRRSQGGTPTSVEYQKRFPQYTRLVRRAFFEPTIDPGSASDNGGATISSNNLANDDAFAPTFEMPDTNVLGDYELLGKLGQGGMGVVYEARHTKTDNRVALKTLRTNLDGQQVDANKLYRFRKEFRSLSEVNHPNLVGMQTLEVDGDRWFFTMDLIQGEDFISYVRSNGELDEARLRACLPQLAKGIIALHQHGIVHRDLKPGNVMVTEDGHVQILDFGLVAELQQNPDATQTRTGMFVGTIPYAAPEQMFGQRTEANDWYGFGTMIYEALAGTLPFPGHKRENLLIKQQEDPPKLVGKKDVPSDLAELVDGLLRRESSTRLGADAVAKFFALDDDTRIQGSTQGSRGSSGSTGSVDEEHLASDDFVEEEIVLIGRETQLVQLEQARQQVLAEQKPEVVWITGLSGEGKSSLVEKFLQPIRKSADTLVLSGRCYDRESVPFKAIDSQIEALVSFLRSRPESQVDAWLPSDIEMLARLFPLLRRVKSIDRRAGVAISHLDERQVRNLAFAAFKDLLVAISRSTSIVMFIDDLQWGDADSAEVLAAMLGPPCPPALLLLGSFRSDEMDVSPFLSEWEKKHESSENIFHVRNVAVEPLSKTQCLELVLAKIGGDDREAIREQASVLFDDTKGNPYFLEQFLEGYDSATKALQPVPLSQIINTRLGRCPAGAGELLEIIAVAGKAVSVAEVAAVSDLSESIIANLTHMRSERLVRLTGSDREQSFDTYHDKIRETVLDGLSEQKRRSVHLKFAEVIEAGSQSTHQVDRSVNAPERLFDLAEHFTAANDARAFRYQLLAGQTAADAFAMETALKHGKIAQRIQPRQCDRELRFQLASLMGRALAGASHLSEAIEYQRTALDLASTKVERANCLFALGETNWLRSEYDAGYQLLREALTELGERLPQSIFGKLLAGAVSMTCYWILPRWGYPRLRSLSQRELSVLSRWYTALNQLTISVDPYVFFFVNVRAAIIARHVDDKVIQAQAFSSFGGTMAFCGLPISHPLMKLSLRIADDVRGARSNGVFDNYYGVYLYSRGRLAEATTVLGDAANNLKRTGDYRQSFANHFLWHTAAHRGNVQEVLKYVRNEKRYADLSGDAILLAYANYGLAEAFAKQGLLEDALEASEASIRVLEQHSGTMLCVARIQAARVHIQAGNYEQACVMAKRALRDIPKARFMEITLPAFSLYVESILATRWTGCGRTPARRSLRKAILWASLSRCCGLLFPTIRPHAYRVSARVENAKRRPRKAAHYFEKAITACADIGAEYEHARVFIDKSMLDHPEAMADRQRGLDLLESLGCVLPDAEVEYLGIDREAHHARAAAARKKYEAELGSGYTINTLAVAAN